MNEAVFRRTHDPELIERILRRDAFDVPIPCFTDGFLRLATSEFLAVSEDVYFVVGEVAGRYAGFAFAHTRGPRLWRDFAASQMMRHPWAVAGTIAQLQKRRLSERIRRARRGRSKATAVPPLSSQVGLETSIEELNRPFAWSAARSDIGQLDQFFVAPEFRGKRLAEPLLRQVTDVMRNGKITMVEAHVDADNTASLRAFLRAGWRVFRTTGRDFYVTCVFDAPSNYVPSPPRSLTCRCPCFRRRRSPERINA